MKHEYHLESFAIGKWLKILQGSLQYCQGFLDARKDYAPRTAYRLMRSDGRVMEEVAAREDVNIGQIAGWPSAEQYESAANKALERAMALPNRIGAPWQDEDSASPNRLSSPTAAAATPADTAALHIWWIRPNGEAVGLMIPGGRPEDAALHLKEALEEGATSVTVMRETVKSPNDPDQR